MLQANRVIAQAEKAFNSQSWLEAIELYEKNLTRRDFPNAHKLNYCYAQERSGRYEAAQAGYLDLSYKNPLDIDIHIETGLFFLRQEKSQDASVFFGRALCVDPDSPLALQGLETLDITSAEKIDSCCTLGGLAGENSSIPPMFALSRFMISPVVRRAMAAMRRHAWHQAEGLFRRILKLSPRYVAMLVQLGHCLREQGKFGDALATYRRAILLAPRDPDVYLHLGHALKAMERRLSALNAYSTALMLRPSLVHALAEIRSIEEFLRSRGIYPVDGQFRVQDSLALKLQAQPDIEPEPWLSDQQKIIFKQIYFPLIARD
jgi:tetratricopeptide (TPR) repeat protein